MELRILAGNVKHIETAPFCFPKIESMMIFEHIWNIVLTISRFLFKEDAAFTSSFLYKYFLYEKIGYFINTSDTFGYYIVVWTIYAHHTYHFTPQHVAFEPLAACLSVVLELLPGFILFAIAWKRHLHKYKLQLSDYNMGKYFRPNEHIFLVNIFFHCCLYIFQGKIKKCKTNTRNTYIWVRILSHVNQEN